MSGIHAVPNKRQGILFLGVGGGKGGEGKETTL